MGRSSPSTRLADRLYLDSGSIIRPEEHQGHARDALAVVTVVWAVAVLACVLIAAAGRSLR